MSAPGLLGDPLDVVGECRLAGNLEGVREVAEAHVAAGVGEMEGELLVAEAVHLLDDGSAQNLLGRDAGPSRTLGLVTSQVFPDQRRDARIVDQDLIDPSQLPRVFMGQDGGNEEIDIGDDSAHPGAAPCGRGLHCSHIEDTRRSARFRAPDASLSLSVTTTCEFPDGN